MQHFKILHMTQRQKTSPITFIELVTKCPHILQLPKNPTILKIQKSFIELKATKVLKCQYSVQLCYKLSDSLNTW